MGLGTGPQATNIVTEAAVTYLSKPFNTMVVTELAVNSWNGYRMDVMAVVPNSRKVTVVEVKTSRGDFHAGKDKFEQYMKFCDRFFVAAPRGLIDPQELPEGVGLLECGDTGRLRLKKHATTRKMAPERYTQMLGRVIQKLCVEGSRVSQMETWAAQNKRWAFRDWLREHEHPRRSKVRIYNNDGELTRILP